MLFERARTENEDDELYERVRQAKRDYDNAISRFNNATRSEMTELAISDMNAAMKRYCFLINSKHEKAVSEQC